MTDPQDALRKTIVARIATFDTSIPEPTPDQVQETLRLLNLVMESIGNSHQDFPLMQKLAESLRSRQAPKDTGPKIRRLGQ